LAWADRAIRGILPVVWELQQGDPREFSMAPEELPVPMELRLFKAKYLAQFPVEAIEM
jgi:hypothetical protein